MGGFLCDGLPPINHPFQNPVKAGLRNAQLHFNLVNTLPCFCREQVECLEVLRLIGENYGSVAQFVGDFDRIFSGIKLF